MANRIKQPARDIPVTPKESGLEIVSLLGLMFLVYTIWHNWSLLPAIIPTHFGASGRPDAWGPKNAVLPLPFVTVFLYIVFSVLTRFPQIYNYPVKITEENAERQYRLARLLMYWIKAQIVWMMAYIQWGQIQVAFGNANQLNPAIMFGFVAALVFTTVWYFIQAYRVK